VSGGDGNGHALSEGGETDTQHHRWRHHHHHCRCKRRGNKWNNTGGKKYRIITTAGKEDIFFSI